MKSKVVICDWCGKPAIEDKRIWGNADEGISIGACDRHKYLMDQVEPKKTKTLRAKQRLKQK